MQKSTHKVRKSASISKKVRTRCGSPPHKWFLVACSSPIMRLAEHFYRVLYAWRTRCVPGRLKRDVLRLGMVGMRRYNSHGHTTPAMHEYRVHSPHTTTTTSITTPSPRQPPIPPASLAQIKHMSQRPPIHPPTHPPIHPSTHPLTHPSTPSPERLQREEPRTNPFPAPPCACDAYRTRRGAKRRTQSNAMRRWQTAQANTPAKKGEHSRVFIPRRQDAYKP